MIEAKGCLGTEQLTRNRLGVKAQLRFGKRGGIAGWVQDLRQGVDRIVLEQNE